jgi:hypothetical protein
MQLLTSSLRSRLSRLAAFSLAEVVVATGVTGMAVSGIIYGYILTAQRAEWSGLSLAAQASAISAIERTRAAKWDPSATVPVDQLTTNNFTNEVVKLDLPISGTNIVWATNSYLISQISSNPPVKMMTVTTTWKFSINSKVFTNKVVVYRSPET